MAKAGSIGGELQVSISAENKYFIKSVSINPLQL